MQSTETEFLVPTSVSEALQSISKEDAIFLGGGTSTALLYKTRLIEPSRVVWLGNVGELKGIFASGGEVKIGSMTTAAEIAANRDIARLLPGVSTASGVIGNARVRAMATLGGALAHADPRQDMPPALIAVGAEVSVKSSSSSRRIPLAEFYEGFLETVLAPDELITEVTIPLVANRRSAYIRYTPTSEGDYPTVGAGSSITFGSDGKTIEAASVVLCGVGSVPVTSNQVSQLLVGTAGDDATLRRAAEAVRDIVEPQDDERGTAAYKREMASIFAFRSLKSCLGS